MAFENVKLFGEISCMYCMRFDIMRAGTKTCCQLTGKAGYGSNKEVYGAEVF